MTEIRLLGICGSLRKASHNMTLLKTAQQLLPTGVSLEIADLTEVPFFNADFSAGGLYTGAGTYAFTSNLSER